MKSSLDDVAPRKSSGGRERRVTGVTEVKGVGACDVGGPTS